MRQFRFVSFGILALVVFACRNSGATEDAGSTLNDSVSGNASGTVLTAQVTVCYSQNLFEGGNGKCEIKNLGPEEKRPRTPDCWKVSAGGSESIEIAAGTKVTVENVQTSERDPLGMPYTLYKIVGPESLFKGVDYKSCWMEVKYLNRDELTNGFNTAAQNSADDSGIVTSTVQKTYLKSTPEDSSILLTPPPRRREEAFFESLQRLPSALHNPQKACLLPARTKLAFWAVRRSSAGGVVHEKGHVFVQFGHGSVAMVGSTPIGINFAGRAPSYDYYDQEPYLTHWRSLIALYPKHSDFFKGGQDVSASATKIGLGCDLNEGWLFVEHFEGWKSGLRLK